MKRNIKCLFALILAASMALPAIQKQKITSFATEQTARAKTPTLEFDAAPARRKSEMFHGSTGFLYGVSEVNVPSADLIGAIAPKILVQKAADGRQHPSGDGYRLTSFLKSCGVKNIQIYLQDFYLEWPYESKGIDDYEEKVKQIVSKMVKGKSEEEIAQYSFVIFNEPNNIWYNGKVAKVADNSIHQDWKKIYQTIKNINPAIKVAGPNFSYYDKTAYHVFFEYCQENNCLPEYITWHELNKNDGLVQFQNHVQDVREIVKTYYKNSGIDPILFVNETVNFDDIGNPGALINWLSIYEEEDVYAALPYWGLANSLNELAADTNKPNGAWWVYKWYAQMTGTKAPLTLQNIDKPSAFGRLYGLTSIDDSTNTIHTLFGGQEGTQTVCLKNIRSTETFKNADKAYVKIYRSKYTGHHGFADETPIAFEGNLAFNGNDLSFTIPDAELMDAYYAIITPAVGSNTATIDGYTGNWEKTYEAENAKMLGNAKAYKKAYGGDLARSNRAEVGNINSENDGVEFSVNVPQNGKYRLNIYYSSQAPQVDPLTLQYVEKGGQNRAIGALVTHSLTVDNEKPQEIVYDSTVKWGYYNYKTVYLNLKAGMHSITLKHKGENQNLIKNNASKRCATLDKIDLTHITNEPEKICVEPEELIGGQKGFTFSQNGSLSGAGSAIGSGDFSFYVNAKRDGYYSFSIKGSGKATLSKSKVNYAGDARAESDVTWDWLKLQDVTANDQTPTAVYLTAGINHLRLTGTDLVLDTLLFTESPETTGKNILTVEAEDCKLTGSDSNDGYSYLPGSAAIPKIIESNTSSRQKAVEGFRGGCGNSLSVRINVPETGNYKLSIFYSNNEPAPVMKTQSGKNYVHPYNTDLVERYMQISVNGESPQTVYFKNTFCWDTFKNTIIDISLQAGDNTLIFSNDNSYKFSAVQDDFTPRLDRFIIAPASLPEAASATDMTQVEPPRSTEPPSTPTPEPEATATAPAESTPAPTAIPTAIPQKTAVPVKPSPSPVKTPQTTTPSSTPEITQTAKKQKITTLKQVKKYTVLVKWKKDKKAIGYQIQYATNRKFNKTKKIWIKKNKTTAKIKNLKTGKTYYVRVRTGYTKKKWGKFSHPKTIRIKRK